MFSYQVDFALYKLRSYEKELAIKEFQNQFPEVVKKTVSDKGIQFESETLVDESKLKRLAFFCQFHYQNATSEKRNTFTNQAIAETFNHSKRTSESNALQINTARETRYLSHTLHEYKGRFYPQLAKSFMNYAGLRGGETVLDPFCGSGTTLVESHLFGANAVGVDINPIAVLIAKAKIRALDLNLEELAILRTAFKSLKKSNVYEKVKVESYASKIDIDYLQNWFPEVTIKKIISIQDVINSLENENAALLSKVVLSNLLRDYSHQDPSDLRIRRRADEPPLNIIEKFDTNLTREVDGLEKFQRLGHFHLHSKVEVHLGDIRQLTKTAKLPPNSIDAVITSPPYATALPYVDTDRLSLFAFGFTTKSTFRSLEESLIGNREITKKKREIIDTELVNNLQNSVLPNSIINLLQKIYLLNKNADVGFRRKNTAALLFKYFLDMHQGVSEVAKVLKKGKFAFFVVGNNRTTAGGEFVAIPTDDFIGYIAEENGLKLVEKISMTVQKSYVLHSKNSINSESILVLQKQ